MKRGKLPPGGIAVFEKKKKKKLKSPKPGDKAVKEEEEARV